MATVRLTLAQALVRYLTRQFIAIDGREAPLVAGVWAIFGHGNVAAMGEALHGVRDELPTWRAHNEQAMAHAAIAFAKASNRRRFMACTTSIGPGATNMVTAAALAHVNRLPVLLLPGDVFASRRPDPVLQQVEDFGDATVSANDCFRPVSRYFDRIARPEQILTSLPQAMRILTDPADCGPVTLALCQDAQAEAFDFPSEFFERRVRCIRRPEPDREELGRAAAAIAQSKSPLIIAGGGIHYSGGADALAHFAGRHGLPVAETQAGKGALPYDHGALAGPIGVTGGAAANDLAARADLVLAVGTRLQDFTSGSRALFGNPAVRFVALNVQPFDAIKHGSASLVADARQGLRALGEALDTWRSPEDWRREIATARDAWREMAGKWTAEPSDPARPPSDAQVLGAVNRSIAPNGVVVCAAGGLPGELHKLWKAAGPGGYHVEYGYSCMGYEIAGGLGVKMAQPDREVVVMVGDGSYLMLNSEIATSVMLDRKLIIVVLDNRGYGCINRLQHATGGAGFNNLLDDALHHRPAHVDFAAHAASLGAVSEKIAELSAFDAAYERARAADRTAVIVLDTDPLEATADGGAWWDVAVPEVSERPSVADARKAYEAARSRQRLS